MRSQGGCTPAWRSWATAAVALVALAIGSFVGVSSPPPLPRGTAEPSADRGVAAGSAQSAVAAPTASPDRAAELARATRVEVPVTCGPIQVRVRVVRDLGDGELTPFSAGMVTVSADVPDGDRWRHALQSCDPATFEVPEGVATIQVSAGFYGLATRRLPDTADGVVDLGEVVLAMERSVRLRVHNAPERLAKGLTAEAWVCGQHMCGRARLQPCDDHLEALLPFSASTCELRLLAAEPGLVINLPRDARLPVATRGSEPGGCVVVDVDLAGFERARIRLVGVPDELMPHVELLWVCDYGFPRPVTIGADGELSFVGLPRARGSDASFLSVHSATGGRVRLRDTDENLALTFVEGGIVEVSPEEPLLGIAPGDRADGPAFQLSIGESEFRFPPRLVHVVGRSCLDETPLLQVRDVGGPARYVARQDLTADGALRRVPRQATPATATLVVRPRVPCVDPGRYIVLLHSLDSGPDCGVPWRAQAFRCEALPAGRYRVELKWRLSHVCFLAEELSLARGATVELSVDLAERMQLVGEIVGWSALPTAARPTRVDVDGYRVAPVEDDGTFAFATPLLPSFSERITVRYRDGSTRAPTAVRLGGGRLEVVAPELHVVPMTSTTGEAAGYCWLDMPDGRLLEHAGGTCLLAEGERVRGVWGRAPAALYRRWSGLTAKEPRVYVEGYRHSMVAAWFELSASPRPQPIDVGRDARFVAVDVRRPTRALEVRVHGPEGWPAITVFEGAQAGVVHVLVVAGTSAIEVVCDGESTLHDVNAARVVVR